jgi:hypothetical protein
MTREEIIEINPDAIFLDDFDEAIIGMAGRMSMEPVVAYDIDKIIDILMNQFESSNIEIEDEDFDQKIYEMAYEYFEYNILNAWLGEHTPIFIKTTLI